MRFYLGLMCINLLLCSCTSKNQLKKKIINPVLINNKVEDIQREVDEIFILLAYSLVYRDWQHDSIPRNMRRGYNIGALLVNENNEPVSYDLNCINSTNDATQHGEVRVISKYIKDTKSFDIKGFTLYTTLEPCIMCAGMITMTSAKRIVFGQHDVEYSKSFERLAMDTRSIGGFGPYPRAVLAQESVTPFCEELDKLYKDFLEHEEEKILAKFLSSDKARIIFEKAYFTFQHYILKYEVNRNILDKSLIFYQKVINKE